MHSNKSARCAIALRTTRCKDHSIVNINPPPGEVAGTCGSRVHRQGMLDYLFTLATMRRLVTKREGIAKKLRLHRGSSFTCRSTFQCLPRRRLADSHLPARTEGIEMHPHVASGMANTEPSSSLRLKPPSSSTAPSRPCRDPSGTEKPVRLECSNAEPTLEYGMAYMHHRPRTGLFSSDVSTRWSTCSEISKTRGQARAD